MGWEQEKERDWTAITTSIVTGGPFCEGHPSGEGIGSLPWEERERVMWGGGTL